MQWAVRIELIISLKSAKSLGPDVCPFGNGAPTAFEL
jgi:hypothetical protein